MNISNNNINFNNTSFRSKNNLETNKEQRVKLATIATSSLGVATSLALISKKQGFSLNPSKIFSESYKKWAIFKIPNSKRPSQKALKLEEKEILTLGASSVVGGLVGGGLADDKSRFKAKVEESISQMLGAISVPLLFVSQTSKLYKNNEAKIDNFMPQFKNARNSKILKGTNKLIRILPPVGMTAVGLSAGIVAGNKVSNFINEKVFKKKADREIRATDFAPHVDDVCLAITLMAKNSPVGSYISKLIPPALLIPGYEVGIAKEG